MSHSMHWARVHDVPHLRQSPALLCTQGKGGGATVMVAGVFAPAAAVDGNMAMGEPGAS